MRPQTFTAASMSEAYEQVRAALGSDALILSTQSSPRFGGAELVEIVATAAPADASRPGLENDLAAHELARTLAETAARRPMPATIDDVEEQEGQPLRSPEELLATIEERTRVMESSMRWLTARRAQSVLDGGPGALRDVYDRLVEHGVVPRLLEPLLQKLEGQLRGEPTTREALRAAERALAALLPPVPRLELGHAGQVVFVVGPASVDKTSIALRLAREVSGGRRGVVASTDTDRAGAPQQFVAAANAAGVESRVCYAPAELRTVLREEAASLVVVDVAGGTGARADRMLELKTFMQVAPRRDVLLALPASMNAADAQRVVAAYAPLEPAGLVLSGIDDAIGFGGVLSAVLAPGIGVAFTATATTTEPLAVGDNHALALAALIGRWPSVGQDVAPVGGRARVAVR